MKNVLVFGEILWDVYKTEKKIGGAPFNFAAHLASLGVCTEIVSSVGDDELGRDALRELEGLNVGKKYVTLSSLPTGYCAVGEKDGHPTYELVRGVAYDDIKAPLLEEKYDGLYFGSLALRDKVSESSLCELLKNSYDLVFFDINVRMPFFDREKVLKLTEYASVLKLSREEAPCLGYPEEGEELCRRLMAEYPSLRQIIMTLDKDGALVLDREKGFFYSEKPKGKALSTVGAGDSFSAAYISGYINGEATEECIRRAILLSNYVCTQLGAIPPLPDELKKEIFNNTAV